MNKETDIDIVAIATATTGIEFTAADKFILVAAIRISSNSKL